MSTITRVTSLMIAALASMLSADVSAAERAPPPQTGVVLDHNEVTRSLREEIADMDCVHCEFKDLLLDNHRQMVELIRVDLNKWLTVNERNMHVAVNETWMGWDKNGPDGNTNPGFYVDAAIGLYGPRIYHWMLSALQNDQVAEEAYEIVNQGAQVKGKSESCSLAMKRAFVGWKLHETQIYAVNLLISGYMGSIGLLSHYDDKIAHIIAREPNTEVAVYGAGECKDEKLSIAIATLDLYLLEEALKVTYGLKTGVIFKDDREAIGHMVSLMKTKPRS